MKKIKKVNYRLFLYLAIVVLINLFVVNITFVFGDSMETTLYDRDIVLVFKFNYSPQVNDIVVTNKENPTDTNLIKRVIALEGQTVVIKDNKFFVDGIELPLFLGISTDDEKEINIAVPTGKVFLIGDNHDFSIDSRHFGVIDENDLLGKVVFRIFSIDTVYYELLT